MSNVNQAFLRAYVKNRAASIAAAQAAAESTDQINNPPTAQQPMTDPSQYTPAPQQFSQGMQHTANEGVKVRIDSSHRQGVRQPTDTNRAPMQPLAIPQVASQSSVAREAGTGRSSGIWSPIGVERGMKATSGDATAPAVVRNGVPPVQSNHSQPTPSTPIQRAAARTASPAPSRVHTVSHPTSSPATGGQATTMPSIDNNGQHYAFHPSHSNRSAAIESDSRRDTVAKPTIDTNSERSVYADLPSEEQIDHRAIYQRIDPRVSNNVPKSHLAAPHYKQMAAPEARKPEVPSDLGTQTVLPPKARSIAVGQPAPHTAPQPNQMPSMPSVAKPAAPVSRQSAIREQIARQNVQSAPLPLPVAFAPSWEVDEFFWPEVIRKLEEANASAFSQIGKHLQLANRDGLKVMAITSGERGVGRSTVAMHMARCAAATGLQVAVVDADTYSPSLIDQLRLDIEHGWQDCLFENVPLEEVAVRSIADGITFFPLTSVISQQQVHANLHRMAKLIKRISTAFDMVFIDANRLNLEQRDMVGVSNETIIDAAIVVVDTELSIKEKVDTAVSILQTMGISSIGLVENFQSK